VRRAIWPVFCATAVFLALPAMALSPEALLEGYARRVWHAEDSLPEETHSGWAEFGLGSDMFS